jgi:hypothetical protein
MRLHLTLRFDYGATVPWVTQLEDESGLSAVAGPSRVALRSAVKLEGKNFATVAEFDVAEGECVPFVLTHVPSHGCAGNGARAKYDKNLNLDLSGSHCQELQLC